MNFLSQIHVGKAEAARLRLHDSYAWHRRLWDAFPGRDGQRRPFLFRVDDKHDSFRVLLLSTEPPNAQPWGAWELAEVGATFLAHDRYLFQVRANPTVKRIVRQNGGSFKKNGRRTGIYATDALIDWMRRKGEQSGFEVVQCIASPPIHAYFVKQGRRGKHIGVDFQGVLRVTDQVAFRHVFGAGIGSAKAFGFGLLMLQPVA